MVPGNSHKDLPNDGKQSCGPLAPSQVVVKRRCILRIFPLQGSAIRSGVVATHQDKSRLNVYSIQASSAKLRADRVDVGGHYLLVDEGGLLLRIPNLLEMLVYHLVVREEQPALVAHQSASLVVT
jgi:hypothetical protein